ncbi:MAG TPA: hypothetical protein VHT73_15930 [Thermodesulfobacteriota bacterium]|nr:hypothetical protein [Thermodesulfobacteriota bacterium]
MLALAPARQASALPLRTAPRAGKHTPPAPVPRVARSLGVPERDPTRSDSARQRHPAPPPMGERAEAGRDGLLAHIGSNFGSLSAGTIHSQIASS